MLNIITNTAAMGASRALNKNQSALAQSFQRLSTGLRINSAKDDAAGNAIANRLGAQYRGLAQAARNANDSISMLQTADSAISEQQNMLQRLRELAVQASSDTNTASDRAALQAEADALISEIDRIATQTSFNGRNLLDGTLSDVKFQVGANQSESVSLTLSGTRNYNLGAMWTSSTTVNGAAIASGNVSLNGVAVADSVSDGVSSTNDTGSALAIATAINQGTAEHGVTAIAEATESDGANMNGAGGAVAFTINGVTVSATAIANDGDSALTNAINAVSSQTGVTAQRVAQGGGNFRIELEAADGRNITLAGLDATETGISGLADVEARADVTLRAESQFTVAGDDAILGSPTAAATAVNVSNLDLGSQSDATAAIQAVDDAISQLNGRQATLGALMNRMDYAVSNLQAAAENIASARSRIRDADFAAETAAFSKNQILQQASASMLAQANIQGQLALSLLG